MASHDQTLPFPTSPAGPSSTAGFTPSGGGYGTDDASAASSMSGARCDSPSLTDTAGTSGDLMGKVVQGAHQTIDRLAEKAAPHVQRLQDGATGAGDRLSEGIDQARAMRDEWAESLRCTVRENPLAAVAAALAIGVLVARVSR